MTNTTIDPRIERTRAAVAAAAAELMLAEGPDSITHARVAAAANVSRTTVYKHWPERSDLLRSTVEEVGKTVPDPMEFNGELRHDIHLLLSGLATDLGDDRHERLMATMLERAQHDKTVAAVRDAMVREIHQAFHDVLTAAVAKGDLRSDIDTERAVASLAGSLIFSRLLAARDIDDQLVRAVIDDFVTTNAPR